VHYFTPRYLLARPVVLRPATKLPTAFNCQQQPCCCQPTGDSILTKTPTAAAFIATCRLVAEQLPAFRRQPQQLQAHVT
jgi:hypothetical protein